MTSSTNFKLDIGCVERDEDRQDFLSAAGKLDLRQIRHLLEVKGVEVNATDSVGQNCLHYVACSAEHDLERQTQLVGFLTSVGADINLKRKTDGWTPLYLAAVFNECALVACLLSNGAAVKVRDHGDMSPEDWADKYRLGQVKTLLVHRCVNCTVYPSLAFYA